MLFPSTRKTAEVFILSYLRVICCYSRWLNPKYITKLFLQIFVDGRYHSIYSNLLCRNVWFLQLIFNNFNIKQCLKRQWFNIEIQRGFHKCKCSSSLTCCIWRQSHHPAAGLALFFSYNQWAIVSIFIGFFQMLILNIELYAKCKMVTKRGKKKPHKKPNNWKRLLNIKIKWNRNSFQKASICIPVVLIMPWILRRF